MKIRPVGAELFHAEGRTNRRDEAHNHFPRVCERNQKSNYNSWLLYSKITDDSLLTV